MQCSICKNKIRAGSVYCHHCGSQLEKISIQKDFENRFAKILKLNAPPYHIKKKASVWDNVGTHPLDEFFTEIADLFLWSNKSQKEHIYQYFGTHPELLENIRYYVRRIGTLIEGEGDEKWLQLGITTSIIDGGRTDFRDLTVSLVLLRYAAERKNINTPPYFDDGIQIANDKMISILENVRDHPENAMQRTVANFGYPKWMLE